jgi:hypothetical protein
MSRAQSQHSQRKNRSLINQGKVGRAENVVFVPVRVRKVWLIAKILVETAGKWTVEVEIQKDQREHVAQRG